MRPVKGLWNAEMWEWFSFNKVIDLCTFAEVDMQAYIHPLQFNCSTRELVSMDTDK